MSAIRAVIRQELPRLANLGTWEYTVVGVNQDGTVNAAATDPGGPMPNLNNVAIQSGPEGGTAAPTAGNLCYVRFVNGDPTRPVVVGNQSRVRTATLDASETVNVGPNASNGVILAGGSAPIARDGDAVTVYFSASPLVVSGTFAASPPTIPGTFTGTLTITAPATGVITTGQPRVRA